MQKASFFALQYLKIDGSRCVGKQERDARVVEHFNGVFNVLRKFDLRVTDDLQKLPHLWSLIVCILDKNWTWH